MTAQLKDRICFEDNHLLIVNKQCGELVQADSTGDICLLDALKAYLKLEYQKPGNVFLGLVHRLDRPTSGLVIFAKTSKALARMNALFQNREIEKRYHALVEGIWKHENGLFETYLAKNESQNKSYPCAPKKAGAKKAQLEAELLKTGNHFSLLELKLLTGRHHQIRAQVSALGHAVKGDLKYGAKRSNPNAGISLHARSLSFIHPVTKEKIDLEAPYPADDIWERL